jgi:3-hydroxyacyl-CoA dehydrogenase/enoyl-CoA hydratase/3-hydroxybutyryl-CoA epimerase
MNTFQYQKDPDGIITITMNMPGRSANVINEEFGEALQDALERLQKEENGTGLIITSAKKTFLAGADIDMIYEQTDPAIVFQQAEQMKAGLRQLETMGKPVVAAINGTALGGGFELALACHHRVAVEHRSTKIGLPEVMLGLIPGGGGITRVVRLIGLEAAAPLLTQGKQLSPKRALQAELIHAVAKDKDDMLAQARQWIVDNPKPQQPWDTRGYRIPGGTPQTPKLAMRLPAMPAMTTAKTYNNYPAVDAIIAAAVEGASVDFDTACRIESRYFAQAVISQEAKNMMTAFWYQRNEVLRGKSRPEGIPPTKTHKVGVIGAGLMGHGIAYVTAKAGIPVVMKDINQEQAEKGKAAIAKIMDKQVSRGRMSAEQKSDILDIIHTTGDAAHFTGCDLIVEAVFENRDLKAHVTKEAEEHLHEDAVFGSNTSTLPISGLAEASERPANFIGLHFFSPVHRMELVEIIVGKETSLETLAKAFDYVIAIKKIPIVVNDRRGFYTSRCFSTYGREGLALLLEGQQPRAIEVANRPVVT